MLKVMCLNLKETHFFGFLKTINLYKWILIETHFFGFLETINLCKCLLIETIY